MNTNKRRRFDRNCMPERLRICLQRSKTLVDDLDSNINEMLLQTRPNKYADYISCVFSAGTHGSTSASSSSRIGSSIRIRFMYGLGASVNATGMGSSTLRRVVISTGTEAILCLPGCPCTG